MTETFTLNTSEIEPFKPESYEIEDEESQYLRCSALIEVFSLVDHVWYRVPVLNLNDPEWMQDPWDQLELSAQRKTLLRTLVNTHTNQNKRSGDLIKKKGKGLVFLFHGQPGLGKTLTAEALSESIKRPLYRVNIGLLAGHQDWEPDLEKIFRDAHSWQAVLLLDEAEVIMEARTKDRMQQNSWCSVFLRKLEYYEGILILTTNMIHSIDKAFRSRINIAIHYDDLSLDQKTSLWKLFIGNLHAERAKTNELLREVDRWAKLNLNGRQIRNVVLTAEALALGESDYLRMEPSHVDSESLRLRMRCFELVLMQLWQLLLRIRWSSIKQSTTRRRGEPSRLVRCLETGCDKLGNGEDLGNTSHNALMAFEMRWVAKFQASGLLSL